MRGYRFLPAIAVGAALFALPAVPTLGDEPGTGDPAIGMDTEPATEMSGRVFDDPERLIDTVMADDLAELEAARAAADEAAAELLAAQQELVRLQADSTATMQQIADAQAAVLAAQVKSDAAQDDLLAAQMRFDDERLLVETQIAALSPEQVFALNRSLNNATHTPFGVDIDSGDLQLVLDGDFNKQQINAFTKAYESESKFLYLAEKTGNDRFIEKAETEKQKFLGKIDRFAADPDPMGETESAVKAAASDDIKAQGKNRARQLAARTARDEAKQEARRAAHGAAVKSAKSSAKWVSKQAAKDSIRDIARQTAKNAAKQAAKDAIKQSVKNQMKAAAKGKK